ncbi:hypothetical protein [Brachyspira murdochii]|uniref:Serpentine_recp domain containing protein n=2 Tax=Brachyspira murdochii TaxID=84378 RepID=D5U428_BRAM5|nr:hypothetical protein [Brachyspira murdochii]ADG72209.1 conserved hypothetical protein [Brachyspira murdochii DSM 12563]PPS21985.1 hypothetical protein DJ52_07535 [Brachyspira murdochii]
MKKIVLSVLIFISLFTKSAFTEFEASIYVPIGITSTFPNIVDPKRNFVRNICIDTTKSDMSFNIGVTGNFGYRFNINENNGISILTEIGYSRLDFASTFKAKTGYDYGNKIYNASQNLVFHTLNIGLMPKYAVNLTSLLKNINPNYKGKMELNIGIGFGMKIALAGEYYNTINNNADENYKSHLAEKYSFKDIKRKFDYPFIPYIKLQIDDYFYFNEKIAFLFGISLIYNFDIFYDIANMSYEDYKKIYSEYPSVGGGPVGYYDNYNIKKYGFSSFEIAFNLGMKFGN